MIRFIGFCAELLFLSAVTAFCTAVIVFAINPLFFLVLLSFLGLG